MVEAEPGISNSELARRTGMSRPWVIKHLKRLPRDQLHVRLNTLAC